MIAIHLTFIFFRYDWRGISSSLGAANSVLCNRHFFELYHHFSKHCCFIMRFNDILGDRTHILFLPVSSANPDDR